MAKKQSTSFLKILMSGAIALVLVGGSIATMNLASQDTNNQSNAWVGNVIRFRPPYYAPKEGMVPFGSTQQQTSRTVTSPSGVPSAEPTVTCWNRVITANGKYYWPNGCKGSPGYKLCTQVVTALSATETTAYLQWMQSGDSISPQCEVTTSATPRSKPTDVRISPTPVAVPPVPPSIPWTMEER